MGKNLFSSASTFEVKFAVIMAHVCHLIFRVHAIGWSIDALC
jgi:hypothetical protein